MPVRLITERSLAFSFVLSDTALYNADPFAGWKAFAKVAELVDALDLGSSGHPREGSSPSFRTTN